MTSSVLPLKYFVGWDAGDFPSNVDLISAARLPAGTTPVGEFPALPGSSKICLFQAPPRSTDQENDLLVVIVEPLNDGQINLWLSGNDLARAQREEAEEDVEEYRAMGAGGFKIFERQ